MTKDTVPPEKFVPRHARRCACAVWFVLGAIAGAFAVGLYWLKQQPAETHAQAPAEAPARPPQPKFEFYNLLPEMEVVLSDAEVAAATARPSQSPPKSAADPAAKQAKSEPPSKTEPASKASPAEPAAGQETYLLQLGSFRRAEDAERLKAQLALQGIQAQIQQVTINGKETFHRVRTGPLRGAQALNDARGRVKKGGVEGIVIKVKE